MDFTSILGNMSFNDLYKAQDLLKAHIKLAEHEHKSVAKGLKVEDFVTIHKEYVKNCSGVLLDGLKADIESLNMKKPANGTSVKWLSNSNEPYSWPSKNGVIKNDPSPLKKCPTIEKLLQQINKDFKVDLNSCLITHYKDGKAGIRLHNDNEPEMDENSPICVLTIGEGRPIEFLSRYQTAQQNPLLTLTPMEGSLYTMEKGCQEFFKHRVPSVTGNVGPRYSLSFRRRIPPYRLVVSPGPTTTADSAITTSSPPAPRSPDSSSKAMQSLPQSQTSFTIHPSRMPVDNDSVKPERKRTTVLFGTSITAKLPNSGLAGKQRKFINVSQSGARIEDIDKLVDNFHATNPAANDVEKVILSFGTNDIKYDSSRAGVNKLQVPIGNLIAKVKHLFPGAVVLVQAVLPMRNLYWYTSRNVMGLNKLFLQLCDRYNCVFVDCFRDFLSSDKRDHNKRLFNDHFHLNFYGRKILCCWLHCIINSSSFDRIVC